MLPKEILQGWEIELCDLKCPFHLSSFFMTLLILKAPRVFHVAKLPVMVYTIKKKLIFSFLRTLITKYWVWTTEAYGLTILEDKTPQSVSRTVFLLKDLGKNLFHAFFQLLVIGWQSWVSLVCIIPQAFSQGVLFLRFHMVLFLQEHQSYWIKSPHYSGIT